MPHRFARLLIWTALTASIPCVCLAGDGSSSGPDTLPAAAPAAGTLLRPGSVTPRPLESAPLIPDPVRFGGFHGKPTSAPSSFLGEGTFVYERPGLFSIDGDGKAIIRFDPDPKLGPGAKGPPPIYVLPNLKRMAIEDAIKGRALPLIVSGTATEYDSHNYLLLDDNTRPAGPPTTAPAVQPTTRPTTDAKNQSADEMLGQLLRTAPGSGARPPQLRWDQPVDTDKTSGNGAIRPGAPGVTLIREGRYLPDRLGRLTRSPDGKSAEFTFETDGKALRDPPLIIMPCAKLAQMQATDLGSSQDLRFRLSGTITEYRGRNYILPEKVVNVPAAVLSF